MLQIPHCLGTRRITVSLMFCERCMYLEYQLHSTMRNHHPQELRGKVPIEMQIYSNEGAWDPFTVCSLGHRISAIHSWLTLFRVHGVHTRYKKQRPFHGTVVHFLAHSTLPDWNASTVHAVRCFVPRSYLPLCTFNTITFSFVQYRMINIFGHLVLETFKGTLIASF